MTGTSDETAEGDLTAGEVDYEAAKTEWLTVFEQGIHSREEFSALFDVAALEDTRSFAGQDGIQYLGYDGVAARKLHQRILDGDAAAHETYKDPVKAAEALLNLQGGSGEMTELLYEAGRQYLFFQKDSTRPGEGSVANVHYIFADGSGIDIPMVFAEESSQIWMLSWETSTVKAGILPVLWTEKIRPEWSMRNTDPGMKIGLPWQNCRKNGCM